MRLAFMLLGFFIAVQPAYADLDYKCLAACTQQGTGATACITQCTYRPVSPSSSDGDMNYPCLNQCLKGGYMYGYCRQACTPVTQ